ncbi:MAG: ADP-ribosylglycohydrolase family protein [Paramuribaculum sp.]|nr:ADP-ribosylglycohydrolase family protein [Paramuribaculum sp.]MDE6051601.1 ADP-ribosylglycohydrolase family protein [Paramuribaculum sp.]
METLEIKNRMKGCLYGQAVGDALGLGSEFMSKEECKITYPDGLTQYGQIVQDAYRRRWPKGAWTDDTDMMLCVLRGFDGIEFNSLRVASNFKEWFNGNPLDIGSHTYNVLSMEDYTENPERCASQWWETSNRQSAANGALMRTSVVGLLPSNVRSQAEAICRLTHTDPRCVGSCVIASIIIHNLVWKGRMLSPDEVKQIGEEYDNRISEWLDIAYDSSDISRLKLDDSDSIGYTLRTLAAAIWCYWHAPTFEDGLLAVVNEGGDADTNAAISCAILGAKFGFNHIPAYYANNLHLRKEYNQIIETFINKVMA